MEVMQKQLMNKKENFNLSKKLLRKLSCNQLLQLLPKIVEKVIYENNMLKNLNKTETNEFKVNRRLLRKDSINNSSTSTIASFDEYNERIYDQSLQQMKSSKLGDSIISSKMADELLIQLQKYTNRIAEKYKKSSLTNDSSITASDLECDMQTSSVVLANNKGDSVNHFDLSKSNAEQTVINRYSRNKFEKSMSINESQTLSKLDKTENTKESCNFPSSSSFEEYDDPQTNFYVERFRHQSIKEYHLAEKIKMATHRSENRKCSNDNNFAKKVFITPKSPAKFVPTKERDQFDHEYSMEVQVDTYEDSIDSDNDKGLNGVIFGYTGKHPNILNCTLRKPQNSVSINRNLSQLVTSNSNCSLNNIVEINHGGDTATEEFVNGFNQGLNLKKNSIIRKPSSSLLKKCKPKITITDCNSLKQVEFQKEKRLLELKRIKKTSDSKFCKLNLKPPTKVNRHLRSSIKFKDFGVATSKIVDGRFRHGWQCTYKECLTFNPLRHPTCLKCFNPRWCQPYGSHRDTICRDCGYINYKSRLYCKKCKYIFFHLKSA